MAIPFFQWQNTASYPSTGFRCTDDVTELGDVRENILKKTAIIKYIFLKVNT